MAVQMLPRLLPRRGSWAPRRMRTWKSASVAAVVGRMESGGHDALRREVERLRAENDELRGLFRVEPASSDDLQTRPVRVLLAPDPLEPRTSGGPGRKADTEVARRMVSILAARDPHVDWRVEHDLARVPDGSLCHQLGDVVTTLWRRGAKAPKTFGVEYDDSGKPTLRRRLVTGEPDSDRFCVGYDGQLRLADDLLIEGAAAHDAGAEHHAVWALKATDVVLARLSLLLASFQADTGAWRERIDAHRPEYEPRYRVEAEMPKGL